MDSQFQLCKKSRPTYSSVREKCALAGGMRSDARDRAASAVRIVRIVQRSVRREGGAAQEGAQVEQGSTEQGSYSESEALDAAC